MKKRLSFIAGIAFVIAAITTIYLIFFFKISEDAYNKIMCYYLARSLTDKITDFNERVVALKNFVHENVHPVAGYENRLDTVAIEKLISGIGWCDQQTRVFMALASNAGITTRLLFLQYKTGGSPHSVSEALSPDGRWVIVDPAYNLDLVNKNGDFATQEDIKNDLTIVSDNIRVASAARFDANWANPDFLSVYGNEPIYIWTKKGRARHIFKHIPLKWLKPFIDFVQNRYIEQLRSQVKDESEFNMLKARAYSLLGDYDKSDILYEDVIRNAKSAKLKYKVQFYRALSLKNRKRYEEACGYITGLLDAGEKNPYTAYLYGLRSSVLERLGRSGDADKDLEKIRYSLDLY